MNLREQMRERRAVARDMGNCPNHIHRVAMYGHKHCEDCLIRFRRVMKKRWAAKKRAA